MNFGMLLRKIRVALGNRDLCLVLPKSVTVITRKSDNSASEQDDEEATDDK